MDEYAVSVYALVEHALRFDAQDKLWAAATARLAQAENSDYQSFVSSMEDGTRDILEEETVDINTLKEILDK